MIRFTSSSLLPIAPAIPKPRATMHAPVRVAMSTIMSGFLSTPRAKASASTSLPSASVLSTSMVLPLRVVSTSPGLVANGPGMLSVRGISPSALTPKPRRAMIRMAPSTAAAPDISVFMVSIPEAGFRLRPPESKVMPFPTNTASFSAPSGSCQISSKRGGRPEPAATPSTPPNPPRSRASRSCSTTRNPSGPAISAAKRAISSGDLSRAGVFTKSRANITASALMRAVSAAAGSGSPTRNRVSATDGSGSL